MDTYKGDNSPPDGVMTEGHTGDLDSAQPNERGWTGDLSPNQPTDPSPGDTSSPSHGPEAGRAGTGPGGA